ncbi:hypothetical protein VI06_03410 [Aquitalea magnusonii]|nr:hypothetical protein VI06_03410 [Aquitalea magnusonii]
MDGIYLTSEEFDALEGLPDQDFRMYMLMRRWVNIATGVVGGAAGATICYRRFREWMEVHRERGSTAAPTVRTDDAMRASIARLSRRGLIKRIARTGLARFVFCYKLLLAKLCTNEEPRVNRDRKPASGYVVKSKAGKGFQRDSDGLKSAAGYTDEPQPSGNFIDKKGGWAASVVDNSDPWVAAAGKLLKKQIFENELHSHAFPYAAAKLGDVMKTRQVSEQELGICLNMARRMRGIRSVLAYAVGVVAQGTIKRRLQCTKPESRPAAPIAPATRPVADPLPVQTKAGISSGIRRLRAQLVKMGHTEFA